MFSLFVCVVAHKRLEVSELLQHKITIQVNLFDLIVTYTLSLVMLNYICRRNYGFDLREKRKEEIVVTWNFNSSNCRLIDINYIYLMLYAWHDVTTTNFIEEWKENLKATNIDEKSINKCSEWHFVTRMNMDCATLCIVFDEIVNYAVHRVFWSNRLILINISNIYNASSKFTFHRGNFKTRHFQFYPKIVI